MSLTPIDIQQKTFGPELRGYNMDEVDDFLDEVVTALKEYDQRVRDAQDRIRALESEVATRGEDESAISRALVSAQKQADTLLAEARVDAERIRSEAHDENELLRNDRDTERMALTQEVARMRATVADLKRRIGELAASVGSDLDSMDLAASEASMALDGGRGTHVLDSVEAEPDGDSDADSDALPGVAHHAISDEDLDPFGVGSRAAEDSGPGPDEVDPWAERGEDVDDADDAAADDLDDEDEYPDAPAQPVPEDEVEDSDDLTTDVDVSDSAEDDSRSGQHLSDDSDASPPGRRPWERGSV